MTYAEAPDFAEKQRYVDDLLGFLEPLGRDISSWRVLEIGGEGGILAGLIAPMVTHLIGTDIINSQATYEGQMLSLLREKFARNGRGLPLEKLEFLVADAQNLPFRDNWFDFCFSKDAFEHIPDPELALRELVRVTKPGGLIYLMFDPLWTADSGSHFLHYIGEPWAHLLESDDDIAERMKAAGASDAEVESYRSHMNRRPVSYYREMFTRVSEECGLKVHVRHEWSGVVDPSSTEHPNLSAASAASGLSTDELLVRGLRLLLEV